MTRTQCADAAKSKTRKTGASPPRSRLVPRNRTSSRHSKLPTRRRVVMQDRARQRLCPRVRRLLTLECHVTPSACDMPRGTLVWNRACSRREGKFQKRCLHMSPCIQVLVYKFISCHMYPNISSRIRMFIFLYKSKSNTAYPATLGANTVIPP